jgi:hypothetical protein
MQKLEKINNPCILHILVNLFSYLTSTLQICLQYFRCFAFDPSFKFSDYMHVYIIQIRMFKQKF